MDKRHWSSAVNIVRNMPYEYDDETTKEHQQVAAAVLVRFLRQFNQGFDEKKFIHACGLELEEERDEEETEA